MLREIASNCFFFLFPLCHSILFQRMPLFRLTAPPWPKEVCDLPCITAPAAWKSAHARGVCYQLAVVRVVLANGRGKHGCYREIERTTVGGDNNEREQASSKCHDQNGESSPTEGS
jgi:hypothetical protein